MAFPYIPVALGAGVLAILLWPSPASAATLPSGPVNGGPRPPPNPFPPGSALATVNPNALGGINARTAPDQNSPLIEENTAFNGTTVAVLQTGIPEVGAPPGSPLEWWRIITPSGGTGYARAVGPQGERNFTPTGNVPLPQRPMPSPNPLPPPAFAPNGMDSFAVEMRRRQTANELRARAGLPPVVAGYNPYYR